MNMDLPLGTTASCLPFSETVIKLEPSSELIEIEDVAGVEEQLYGHSSNIVQVLASSLSPCSPPPPPITINQPINQKHNNIMANSGPSARTGEKSAQQVEVQGDIAESTVTVQPFTVNVYASQRSSSSSEVSNLPPSTGAVGKEVTQGQLKEAVVEQPAIVVKAYASHDVDRTSLPQLTLSGHSVSMTEKDKGERRERVEGERIERERRNKEVTTMTAPSGNRPAGIAIHSVSSLGDDDNRTPDSSQNLSQQPGPPDWSESQRRSLDSDAFYSSDSQPPSLKMIRLESPSPSPESPLSLLVLQTDAQSPRRQVPEHTGGSPLFLLVAQTDAQSPQRQVSERPHTTGGSPLSLLVAQTDTQSPRRQAPESSHTTGESMLSLLVAQMEAQSTHQQDPSGQNVTQESYLVVAQMDAQSQQLEDSEHRHTVEQSPVTDMDTQPQQQLRDPERQNITEEDNHGMECSSSGGFLYNLPPDNGEEEVRKMEVERERVRENKEGEGRGGGGRIEPPVVGREREESRDGASIGRSSRDGAVGRVLERGRDGHTLQSMFGRFGSYKRKVQVGSWIKSDEAPNRIGETANLRNQGSMMKGQNSKSVGRAIEQPLTSSGQRGSGDHRTTLRDQRHDDGESVCDEPGTLEVDVVGMGSQPAATLEVDVEGTCSPADEMKTTGAAPLKDALQQSGKGSCMPFSAHYCNM